MKPSVYTVLKPFLKEIKVNKGDYLLRPGEIQRELYFVQKGVQMSFFDADSKLHVMAFTYPPDLCADPVSFYSQKESEFFIQCLSDSVLECISFDRLQIVLDESHELEHEFRLITEQVLSGVIRRHLELSTMTIEERYKAFCKRSPHVLNLAPHKYIASYLGIDPTNFSKLFNSVKI